MNLHRCVVLALLTSPFATASGGSETVIGSPVINRPLQDSSSGFSVVYRGDTQPVSGPGEIQSWSLYVSFQPGSTRYVTPLLIEVTAPDTYEVVAIGASRQLVNQGVNSYPFAVSVGTAVLDEAKQYTIGFTYNRYDCDGAFQAPSVSSVKFDGYGITEDMWSYVDTNEPPPVTGVVYGAADFPTAFNGRVYSVQFTSSTVPPTCPADLTFDGTINSQDLNTVLAAFGSDCPDADVNGDGTVNSLDLNAVLVAFGSDCPD